MSILELTVLVGLARSRRPRELFEIGTYDGRTTLNLYHNLQDVHIRTMDLPPANQKLPGGEAAGNLITDLVEAGRMTQVYGDTLTFDFSPFFGTQDFVFIDADHSYAAAKADSRTALRMVAGREGTIVWHDYGTWNGVVKAVEETRADVVSEVTWRRVEGASLAVMMTQPGCPLRLSDDLVAATPD